MSAADTVGIVGAGPFGAALAHLVAGAGRKAILWSQTAEVVRDIVERRSVGDRLPGLELHPNVEATSDPAELAAAARFLVVAVSSSDVRSRLRMLGDVVDARHVMVHAVGALASPGEVRVSELMRAETPALRIGALAGPSLPGDLLAGRFASMVVASEFEEVTREARRLLAVPPALRIYHSRDLPGVELAAALAGAYTLALGIAQALDIGTGARAVLMTRAVAEASRLLAAAGAEPRTFAGLSGLGNLLVRSAPDREEGAAPSFLYGLALGRGESPGRLTEGARAAAAGVRLARRHGVRVPVLDSVAAVLDGEMTPQEAARAAADTVALEE